MSKVIDFFKTPWVVQLLGLLAASVLIWWVGPLIAIAGHVPLESDGTRIAIVVGLFLGWIGYRLLLLLRSIRREQQLLAGLKQVDSQLAADEAVKAEKAGEVEALRKGFDEALAVLKETRTGKGGKRAALYDMPWYAIIGAPGCGKTTALVNSGLRFPLAEKLGRHSIKGVSGTRNCDWWFSDEAVLLDTAGRYTTQDSHQAVDAAAWEGFLQLLKSYRPRRPLNGIFVAVSASDLLQQTEEERRLHAAAIRRRVHELYQSLGVNLPIYTLFTKCDLVAGFTDFFADLGSDDRAQVWGETFPLKAFNVSNDRGGDDDAAQRFQTGFDELLLRLNLRVFKRMQEERDVLRRSQILDFPQQLAMLKPLITDFLQAAFGANRYEAPVLVRGVYMTSGTQEGTPIDRVMGLLAQTFRLDRQTMPVFSGKGKSFFLTRLIREVIFPEAELVGVDPRVESRWRWLQIGAYASTIGVALLAVVLWVVSYQRNQAAIASVEEQIAAYLSVKLVPTDTKSNFDALLPRLDALRAARDVYADTGWTMGLGLYQGDKLKAGIDGAYEHVLKDAFAPVIVQRLKERMQGEEGGSPEVLYQLLRVYLMFGDPARMDVNLVKPWVKLDWEHVYATDPAALGNLALHLNQLLLLQPITVTLEEPFIAAVRSKLTQSPVIGQIYARFKAEAVIDHSHDFKLGSAMPPTTNRAFIGARGEDVGTLTIPALFTGYGYTELFLKRSLSAVKEAVEQNWVLGTEQKLDPGDVARIHEDLKKLYLGDYQRAWRGLIDSIRLKPVGGTKQTIDILDVLGRPEGPLRALLDVIEKNTQLSKLTAAAAGLMTQTASKVVGGGSDDSTQKMLEVARQSLGTETGPDPVRALELHFEPLNSLVRAAEPGRPVPLDATLSQALALRDYLMQFGSVPNAGGQALRNESVRYSGGGGSDVVQQSRTEFSHLPEPVRSWLLSLADTGQSQVASGAKKALNDRTKAEVGAPCQEILRGRYPFVRGANQDVLMADFAKLFAANGVMDRFFQANLKDFVDTTKPEWREMSSEKPLGLSVASIRQFQRAARIKDAFFGVGGSSPQVQFELKPLSLDNTVATFRFSLEGQEAVYRHGPEQVTKFQWPGPSSGSGVRVVFETLDGRQISKSKDGPWGLFRLLDDLVVERTGLPDRFNLTFQAEGYTARYELRAGSVNNPLSSNELQSFRCPEGL